MTATGSASVGGMSKTFPIPPLRWSLTPAADPAAARVLADALQVPVPLAALLLQRGVGDAEVARRFLKPELASLADPLSLAGMDRAVEVIVGVIRAGGTILVHGDYDVDGQ